MIVRHFFMIQNHRQPRSSCPLFTSSFPVEELLREGLASLHRSADRYKFHSNYAAAEREAQNKRLRLWENYDPQAAAAAEAEAAAKAASQAAASRERRTGNESLGNFLDFFLFGEEKSSYFANFRPLYRLSACGCH